MTEFRLDYVEQHAIANHFESSFQKRVHLIPHLSLSLDYFTDFSFFLPDGSTKHKKKKKEKKSKPSRFGSVLVSDNYQFIWGIILKLKLTP